MVIATESKESVKYNLLKKQVLQRHIKKSNIPEKLL